MPRPPPSSRRSGPGTRGRNRLDRAARTARRGDMSLLETTLAFLARQDILLRFLAMALSALGESRGHHIVVPEAFGTLGAGAVHVLGRDHVGPGVLRIAAQGLRPDPRDHRDPHRRRHRRRRGRSPARPRQRSHCRKLRRGSHQHADDRVRGVLRVRGARPAARVQPRPAPPGPGHGRTPTAGQPQHRG